MDSGDTRQKGVYAPSKACEGVSMDGLPRLSLVAVTRRVTSPKPSWPILLVAVRHHDNSRPLGAPQIALFGNLHATAVPYVM